MLAAVLLCASMAQLPPLTAKTADEYLAQLREDEPQYTARLETIAKSFVGVPYAADPLGDGPESSYDPGPLIDLSQVDAYTYVDQCIALAAASSLEEATRILNEIRYILGDVSFERRNHMFIADWTINNAFVKDITRDVFPRVRDVMRFVSRKRYFKETPAAPLFANEDDEGFTISYIWSQDAAEAEPNIPNGAIVAFVGRVELRFCVHVGFYFRDEEGRGALYHASAEDKRVLATDLADYLTKSPTVVGFKVYEIRPERMRFLDEPGEEPAAAPEQS